MGKRRRPRWSRGRWKGRKLASVPSGRDGGVLRTPAAEPASPPIGRDGLNKFHSVDLFGNPLPAERRVAEYRHVPTPALRERIRELRAQRGPRLSVKAIAALVGLGKETLFRHYAPELGSASEAWRRVDPRDGGPSSLPRGRPRHAPTMTSRERVANMRAAGLAKAEIARAIEITVPTLCRHYAAELGL